MSDYCSEYAIVRYRFLSPDNFDPTDQVSVKLLFRVA